LTNEYIVKVPQGLKHVGVLVNANREYFEAGARDMAQAESEYPGWLSRLLTDPVDGLHNYEELFRKLTISNGAIKVFCKVAEM
jgi:glucose 1-dehydrogenase